MVKILKYLTIKTHVRPGLHGYVFKSFRFHFVAFSNLSTCNGHSNVCVFMIVFIVPV